MKNLSDLIRRFEEQEEEPEKVNETPEPSVEVITPVETIQGSTTNSEQLTLEGVVNDTYSYPVELNIDEPKKNVVTQANVLVKASYELSINAKRVLLLGLSKIDSRRSDLFKEDYSLRLTARDFLEVFGGHEKSAYREFIRGLDDLFDADVVEMDNENEFKSFRWISNRYYHKNLGYADIRFTKEVMLYVSNLTSAFTSYKLMHVGGLRSVYAIRLYELLMTEERKGRHLGFYQVDLMDLRYIFSIPDDKYRRYADLNKAVVARAVKEINDRTNLTVTVEPQKKGRVVQSLRFHFSTDVKKLKS